MPLHSWPPSFSCVPCVRCPESYGILHSATRPSASTTIVPSAEPHGAPWGSAERVQRCAAAAAAAGRRRRRGASDLARAAAGGLRCTPPGGHEAAVFCRQARRWRAYAGRCAAKLRCRRKPARRAAHGRICAVRWAARRVSLLRASGSASEILSCCAVRGGSRRVTAVLEEAAPPACGASAAAAEAHEPASCRDEAAAQGARDTSVARGAQADGVASGVVFGAAATVPSDNAKKRRKGQ